jgi:hypothetical protein
LLTPSTVIDDAFTVLHRGQFCCDQKECVDGQTEFLFGGKVSPDTCKQMCMDTVRCNFATINHKDSWCMNAENCQTTSVYDGDNSGVVTYQLSDKSVPATTTSTSAPTTPLAPSSCSNGYTLSDSACVLTPGYDGGTGAAGAAGCAAGHRVIPVAADANTCVACPLGRGRPTATTWAADAPCALTAGFYGGTAHTDASGCASDYFEAADLTCVACSAITNCDDGTPGQGTRACNTRAGDVPFADPFVGGAASGCSYSDSDVAGAPVAPSAAVFATATAAPRPAGPPLSQCLSAGSWVAGSPSATPSYTAVMPWQQTCDNSGRPWAEFLWQATDAGCRATVDAVRSLPLCDAFAGKSVLVIGDSISHLFFGSLVLQTGCPGYSSPSGQPVDHIYPWMTAGDGNSPLVGVCGGTAKVRYIRNDNLAEMGGDVYQNRMFWEDVRGFDVVVFNTGAHFIDAASHSARMKDFATKLKTYTDPSQHLFWRPTIPGHPNCEAFKVPGAPGEPVLSSGSGFHWREFHARDAVSLSIIKAVAPDVQMTTVQSYDSGVMRKDRHIGAGDCLHYCMPGPVDWWVRIFAYQLHTLPPTAATAPAARLQATTCAAESLAKEKCLCREVPSAITHVNGAGLP